MQLHLRVIFFAMLMVASGVALAQLDDELQPDLYLPDAELNAVLPDSAPPADTALMALGDTAQLVNAVTKKSRRLELPRSTEATVVDTVNKSRVLLYTVNHATNDAELKPLDTSIFLYRTDYPFFRKDVGAIFLGYLASPVVYYDYFKRQSGGDFIFQQPYEPYFFSPSNATFYNTTTPYTLLYYDWAGSKSQMEDQLRVLHAQNVANNFGFVLEYNTLGTKGQYQRQHVKSRAFHFGLSYMGRYYKASAGYIFNDVEGQESGGIVDDKMITDTLIDAQMHLVRLQGAKNVLKNSRSYFTHSVDVPLIYFGNDSVINNILMARFGHSLEYSTYSKIYSDQSDADYYTNNFLSSSATRDSLGLRNFENRLFFQLRPLRAYIFESLTAGVGYKSMEKYMFEPAMYLRGTSSGALHTTYAYAMMSAWYKQYFKWNAFGEVNLSGYKGGDTKLGGNMTLSVYPIKQGIHLSVGAVLTASSPDMFIQNYAANHYKWENNFDRDVELRLEAKLAVPELRSEVGVSQSVHSNFIYFAGEPTGKYGDNVFPKQYSDALSITSATVNQNFEAAGFHFNHRLLFQVSTNQEVISLPAAALSASYYYECDLVKKVLHMQLGVDVQYATRFNGYGYNPAVGMFYTAQGQQGGYLWTDAFIAFRWKSATPFFKYEHAGQGLIEGNTAYFSAMHYPRNARVLKMGLSWKFLD